MKQIMYGMVAATIVCLGVFISLTICGRESRKRELETQMSAAMKQTMKEVQAGRVETKQEMSAAFLSYFLVRMDAESDLRVSVLEEDVARGLLRVKVVETYRHPTGQKGQLVCEKLIILDEWRQEEKPQMCKIEFYSEDAKGEKKQYKTYEVQKGENMPQPREPRCRMKKFCGWQTEEKETIVFNEKKVTKDETFYARFQ